MTVDMLDRCCGNCAYMRFMAKHDGECLKNGGGQTRRDYCPDWKESDACTDREHDEMEMP